MGSVTVLSSLGKGQYNVRVNFDNFVIDQRQSSIQGDLAGFAKKLKDLEDKKAPLDAALRDAKMEMDNYTRTATAKELVSNQHTMNGLIDKVFKAQAAVELCDNEIKRLKLKKTSLEKEKAYLEKNCPRSIETTAWCVEYNEDLTGEMESIEVDYLLERDPITNQIRNDTGVWLPGLKKAPANKLQHILATSSFAAWFNLCMAPAMQRHKGMYRIATVSGLDDPSNDGTKCNIEFIGRYDIDKYNEKIISDKPILPNFISTMDASAGYGGGNIVSQQIKYSGGEIVYMDSDAAAFEDGDKVIVDLHKGEGVPTVIGFYSNPREGATGSVLVCPVSDSAPNGWGQPFAVPPVPPSTTPTQSPAPSPVTTPGTDPGTMGGAHSSVLMTYGRPRVVTAANTGFILQRGFLAADGGDPVAGNCYWSDGKTILTWAGPWGYHVAPDPVDDYKATEHTNNMVALGYSPYSYGQYTVYQRWGADIYKGGAKWSNTAAYCAPPRHVLGVGMLKTTLIAVCMPLDQNTSMGEVFFINPKESAWTSAGDIPFSPVTTYSITLKMLGIIHIFSFSKNGTQASSIRMLAEGRIKSMITRLSLSRSDNGVISFAADFTVPEGAHYTYGGSVGGIDNQSGTYQLSAGKTYVAVGYNKDIEVCAYLQYSMVSGTESQHRVVGAYLPINTTGTSSGSMGASSTKTVELTMNVANDGADRVSFVSHDYQLVNSSENTNIRSVIYDPLKHEDISSYVTQFTYTVHEIKRAVLFWDLASDKKILLKRVFDASQTETTGYSANGYTQAYAEVTGYTPPQYEWVSTTNIFTSAAVPMARSEVSSRELEGLASAYESLDTSATGKYAYATYSSIGIYPSVYDSYAATFCSNPKDTPPTVATLLNSVAYGVVDPRLGLVAHAYTECPTSATTQVKHSFNIIQKDRTPAGLSTDVKDFTVGDLLAPESVLGVSGANPSLAGANGVKGISRI